MTHHIWPKAMIAVHMYVYVCLHVWRTGKVRMYEYVDSAAEAILGTRKPSALWRSWA